MKKFIKLLLKLGLILAVLVVAGLVTLRLLFPPAKIKQMTLDYAKNTLHREISFDSLSFNLIGVTLENFSMSEEGSFEKGTFIQAKRLEAKAAFMPLLKKQIEISTLALNGLTLHIQKNKDGAFNFDSLAASSATPPSDNNDTPPVEHTQEMPFVISAKHLTVQDCDIYYKDLQTGFSTSVEDLNIHIENFDLNTPFPAHIAFTSQTQEEKGPAISIPVNIDLEVFLANLDMPKAYVSISNAQATYKKVKFNLQGKAENLENPILELTGSLAGLDHTALADFLPDLPHFTLPTLQLTMQAAADLQASTATLKQASIRVLNSALSTQGTLGWGEQVTYRLTGHLQADIAQLVKMTEGIDFSPKGNLSAQFTATDKKEGKDIKGTLTLKNLSALYPPFTLTQLNGTIHIASLDDISCTSLTGLLNEEKFTSSFAYKNIQDMLDLTLRLNLDKLTLKEFPSFENSSQEAAASSTAQTATPATQTYMNIDAQLTVGAVNIPYFRTDGLTLQGNLKNVSESMHKANGTVSFALKPGAITDMDKLIKQSKIARIVLLPLGLLHAVGKKLNLNLFEAETQAKKGEIAMTQAEGHYTFTNGVMNIDSTTFKSSLTDLKASGTANFVTNALNMKASATLLTKQTPVVIKITGTLDNPSGKLDVLNTVGSVVEGILSYKTAKAAASTTVNTASNIAGTTAKDTAKAAQATVKALGSLFKKKPDPQAATTPAP